MANQIVRDRLVANIKTAVHQAEVVAGLEHEPSKGTFREIAVQNLLRPLLRPDMELTSGIVVDSRGQQSRQIDVIVYSSNILPPLMVESGLSCVPAEACVHAIEVKSKLTATEVQKAVKTAISLVALAHQLPGPSDAYEQIAGTTKLPIRIPTVFSVLAFDSDLAEDGKSELDRMNETIMKEVGTLSGAIVHNMCVIGRGFWDVFNPPDPTYVPATKDYDEVLAFLLWACDSWPLWVATRGQVRLLPYFLEKPFPE